jgi:hypothetical protein
MQGRILEALASGPLSKAEISDSLGLKSVTGYLNRIVRELLSEGRIEYTLFLRASLPSSSKYLKCEMASPVANHLWATGN